MARTQLNTAQLGDASVQRDDLDSVTTTKAVVRKIIQGTNVTLSSTGVDSGTGDVTINAAAGSVTITSVDIPFTDGDTLRRVTIVDAGVTGSSKIIGTVRRADTADDSEDKGFIYNFNIVYQGAGSFDILVQASDWGVGEDVVNPPNETIKFLYTFS